MYSKSIYLIHLASQMLEGERGLGLHSALRVGVSRTDVNGEEEDWADIHISTHRQFSSLWLLTPLWSIRPSFCYLLNPYHPSSADSSTLTQPAHLAHNPVPVPHFLQFCLRIPGHTLPWGCVEGGNGPEQTHLRRDLPLTTPTL